MNNKRLYNIIKKKIKREKEKPRKWASPSRPWGSLK